MRWFGFGFNAFGQIHGGDFAIDDTNEVKVITPTELTCHVDGSCCKKTSGLRASWSRRASLHWNGGRCLCLAGFKAASGIYGTGCTDAVIGESFLILAFPDRIESWDMDNDEKKTPVWSMEVKTTSDSADAPLNLPLITDGYIAIKPPFYRPLSPHLKATRLAMGAEHSVLLSASGAVYTWGLGSHGQLGHGGLSSEEQPRVVEALWGMTMSCIATGGWHTVCISDGGDLYVWGWNESGQLGLPSRAVRRAQQHQSSPAAADSSSYTDTPEGEKYKEVFISIQAFPALLDITPSCEVTAVGCGSRHTAAVTSAGDLYTWGWGEFKSDWTGVANILSDSNINFNTQKGQFLCFPLRSVWSAGIRGILFRRAAPCGVLHETTDACRQCDMWDVEYFCCCSQGGSGSLLNMESYR
ncbi:RCC1 domain-containing protein 1-like isoform X2 [Phyllopteryx taeniolatus]|uniref:RCC1 domain-containing protein 1-like isoform X2 n=1 Tax=Phyllopteryx taeniolatus TaxID=161469 RepID=UPI002AD2136B|nr:RCC1 domain-containing protein 1-like isoform X2 [Phyllopteryx taeniolatus]